jgi:hypothetical protein
MKIIEIIRGGQKNPIQLKSGDVYDSKINVYSDNGELLHTQIHVNTDFTAGYKGGILAEGAYYAIIGMHKGQYKAPMMLDCNPSEIDLVKDWQKIPDKYRIMPSLIGNPNQNNKKIITAVNSHKGGTGEWDWSHGCITIYSDYWHDFIKLFEFNEICVVNLIRSTDWIVPEFYKEKI